MKLRYPLALWIAAGCGGKSAASKPIDHETAAPSDGVTRLDDQAPLRDCPPGALDALRGGWTEPDEEPLETTPRLDACLHGKFGDGGQVLVYASAPHGDDSQSEAGYPARRVIFSADGRIVTEGPRDGGDWMVGPARLVALVDLDGDGIDEALEHQGLDPVSGGLTVLRLGGGELGLAGFIVTDLDEEGYRCTATWSVSAADATGKRTLVVEVEQEGQRDDGGYGGDDLPSCPGDGTHNLTIGEDGMVVDSADAQNEDEVFE